MNTGDAHFQKGRRLLKANEYETVFKKNQFRASNQQLLVLAYRSETTKLGRDGRLGLVIGKKSVALAAERNRIKRQSRELFRCLAKNELKSLDVLLVARKGLAENNNEQFRKVLSQLFQQIMKQAKKHHEAQAKPSN